MNIDKQIISCGIGLRHQHLQQIIDESPNINWLEVHSENFFNFARSSYQLDKISEKYPLSMHGVGMSIGSADELDKTHLQNLKNAINRYQPKLISEHLSWGSIDNKYFNDLLPMPYTDKSLQLFCKKIIQVQDFLGRKILIENPSSYLQFKDSNISEWEFFASLPNLCGCGLLLDINNIFVSSKNHNFSAMDYISAINGDDIFEIHLAGHSVNNYENGSILIDDHGSKVCDEVWNLYKFTIDKFGKIPTLIEWDTNIPALNILLNESSKAEVILNA
jgi:uncharacterized protein (UPF0276 family)